MEQNIQKGKLFVISAPSGAGKTTLAKEVIKRLSNNFNISKVTTYTTRSPRKDEERNTDYHFISEKDFEQKLKNGFFLETTKYSGQHYGSPKNIITDMELGKSFVIVTDLIGVKEIKKTIPKAIFIWISAPSLEELKNRLIKREPDKNIVERRFKLAEEEIKEAEKPRLFDYKVVNDVFDQTVSEITSLIKNELEK